MISTIVRKPRGAETTAIFLALAAFGGFLASPLVAQAPLPGGTWESIPKLPDWTGGWADYDIESGRRGGGGPVPFNSAAQPKDDAYRKLAASGGEITSRSQNCYPPSFSGVMGGPVPYMEFLFSPGRVTITTESGSIRRIYTDDRKLPEEPAETFHGFSVGRWEGETLVVETVGLDRNNSFSSNIPVGENFRVSERIFLTANDRLQIDSTIVAPAILTGPYKVSKEYSRHRNYTMQEYNCSQNNRDVDPKTGKQFLDLTPPDDLPPPPKE